MKFLKLIFLLFPLVGFSQTKIYVDPKDSMKLAVTAYENLPFVHLKPNEGQIKAAPKDVNFLIVGLHVVAPRDSTVFYKFEIKAIPVKVNQPPPPKPDLTTTIDNVVSEARNKYTGTWDHPSGTTWLSTFFDKTGSYTFTNGSYLETTFDGHKIEWYTEKKSDKGIAAISIDGGDEVELDLYSATTINNSQLAWTSPTLTNGPHKIKIRYTGKKNTAALVPTIIHDYFRVYKLDNR